jgi:sugar transferase (PEP-CTERM system associated)
LPKRRAVPRVFRHHVPAVVATAVITDIAAVAVAISVPYRLGLWLGQGPLWPKATAVLGVTLFALHLADLYKAELAFRMRELVARLVIALACAAFVTAALGFTFPALRLGRLAFGHIFGLLAVGLLATRLTGFRLRASDRLRPRVLVLGINHAAAQIVELQTTGSQPFTLLGFLDDDPAAADRVPAGAELLAKAKDLLTLVDELQPDIVVAALPEMRGVLRTPDLLECRLRGVQVDEWPTFYEKQTGKVLVTGLRPSWLIFSDGFVKTHFMQAVKRGLDIGASALGLLLASPVMLAVCIAIKLDSRGPVIFRQTRVGLRGRIFNLYKFRSMTAGAERRSGAVWAASDDPRITRVGHVLRKTRLDELPQLFNVLRGDMSLVGPRPERPEFMRLLQREIPFYGERLAVKPGLTGWAQVRHAYAASVEDTLEKLQYDLYYVKNLSPFLDVLILLHTVQVVLFARGAR